MTGCIFSEVKSHTPISPICHDTPFPHISECNSLLGAQSFVSPPRHPFLPYVTTPCFPTCHVHHFFLFFSVHEGSAKFANTTRHEQVNAKHSPYPHPISSPEAHPLFPPYTHPPPHMPPYPPYLPHLPHPTSPQFAPIRPNSPKFAQVRPPHTSPPPPPSCP